MADGYYKSEGCSLGMAMIYLQQTVHDGKAILSVSDGILKLLLLKLSVPVPVMADAPSI
jgi:hypothetical protein